MTDAAPERRRFPVAALGFAVAAALSSWNPLSAPFGLAVGLAALALAVGALRAGYRRSGAAVAIALSGVAVLASGLVLALTAGVGRDLGGDPVVAVPPGVAAKDLDAAAERTRESRERARRELEALDAASAPSGPPAARPSTGSPGGGKGERKGAPADAR